MPHIIIECSDNIVARTDLDALVRRVHETALETGIFPLGGTRTRVAMRDRYRIADGHPDNAFVHVLMRIGRGRDDETKRRAASAVFDAVCAQLNDAFERTPLAISLELEEIDLDFSFKQNNLHRLVEERRTPVA